jgi:DNA-binding transcriptional ArsR family regulator
MVVDIETIGASPEMRVAPRAREHEAEIDLVLHALSDATRRDLLRRAADGGSSVSSLARNYSVSFAAIQKHVAVLERAGLVSKTKRGREQLVQTEPDAVAGARQVLDDLEELWRGRIERMGAVLREEDPKPNGSEISETTPEP